MSSIFLGPTPAGSGPSVDFSELGIKITHRFSNPVIWIPTPTDDVEGATPAIIGENVKGVNIGFLSDIYTLAFTLLDGFGSTYTSAGTKNYEKIVYLSRKKNPKCLVVDGYAVTVHIESFNISFAGGDKDLALNCNVNLRACDNIQME